MSKNKNKSFSATPSMTPTAPTGAQQIEVMSVPFPPSCTTPDAPPTDVDRQLRILAGLGLYALGLVAAFGGATTGRKMQSRGLEMLGIANQPTLTATAGAILEVVEREWGV